MFRQRSSPPLPPTIFSQPLSTYSISLTKHILSIFHQQSTFKKREARTSLLQKLARIENTRTENEREAVAQLLRRGLPVTRAAVKSGPQYKDDESEFLEEEEHRECEVCLEILPTENFSQQPVESTCEHKTSMCTECLKQAIIARVENNRWEHVPCPFSGCEKMLQSKMVRKFLTGKLLKNYVDYVDTVHIRNLPNFRWCLNPECGAGQVHQNNAQNPRIICSKCNSESCFKHQIPWDKKKMCRTCNSGAEENALSEKVAKRITKPCPRCQQATLVDPIGCGWVTCPEPCNYRWSWNQRIARVRGTILY